MDIHLYSFIKKLKQFDDYDLARFYCPKDKKYYYVTAVYKHKYSITIDIIEAIMTESAAHNLCLTYGDMISKIDQIKSTETWHPIKIIRSYVGSEYSFTESNRNSVILF
jgi:hypothetical protein